MTGKLVRSFAAAALAAGLGLAMLSSAAAEKLRLGNEGTYPPFSIVDPQGKLTGFEPELAREMCTRLKAECEFVVMDFSALIPSLLQKKVDIIVSQVKPLPERKEKALFSAPVVFNPDSFVIPKDKSYEFTKAGLKGTKVAIQRGSAQAKYVVENFGDVVEAVYYDNPDQIRLDLISKRVDMTYGAKLNWSLSFLNTPEGKDWKLAGGDRWSGDANMPESDRGLSWIVRKGEDALMKRIDVVLAEMIKDCTFTKLREKFIPVPVLPAESSCGAKPS